MDENIERYIQGRVAHGVRLDPARWRRGALRWLDGLPIRFREELTGLAHGARLPLQRLAEWTYLEVVLASQCSGVIVSWEDQTWVARNNDTFVPDLWGYATIREIPGRIPTISFGLEGDVFTPTGINQARLWLHYNHLPTEDEPPADQPHMPCYAFLVEALETCETLQAVEALLEDVPRDTGMLLFAVEGKTNNYALYECRCTDFRPREVTQGWLLGTNHGSEDPRASSPPRAGGLNSFDRYQRLEVLVERWAAEAGEGSPVQALREILADDGVEARTGDIVTAYANVACPAAQEVWYTFGGYPAASCGNWQKLEWPW